MASSSPNPFTADPSMGRSPCCGRWDRHAGALPSDDPHLGADRGRAHPAAADSPRRGIDRDAVPAVVPPSGCPR